MKIRSAGLLSGLVVSAALLSGCVQPTAQSNSPTNTTAEIVPPWGGPTTSTSANAPANTANDKFVMAPDPKKAAITDMQRQQIDEARIALGILDRMAQRCVQQNDPAACNTLQTNWSTLSQQLRKSLAIISGDSMGTMPSAGAPMMADPTAGTSTSGPVTMPDDSAPTMEKSIPMMSRPADG